MFPIYDEVYILLDHMLELYAFQDAGNEAALARLKESIGNYRDWLVSRKKVFNRKRSMSQGDLESELLLSAQTGDLDQIIKNPKLSEFIGHVLIERQVFNYGDLTLHSL